MKANRMRYLRLLCAVLLLCLLPARPACAATASDITKKCRIRVSEGSAKNLTDGKVTRYWQGGAGSRVAITLPSQSTAGLLQIEWFTEPGDYVLEEYTANDERITYRTQDDTYCGIVNAYRLNADTKKILLTLGSDEQKICGIHVYSKGKLPKSVQVWEAPVEKADLMVVSAHQDDEVIYLGGVIPYYDTALGVKTVVTYMTTCGRNRRAEALAGLWVMGVKHFPEFINLPDEKTGMTKSLKLWGGKKNIVRVLVERIRRYRPEVIVTHDLKGEYGHNQHKITASAMESAIKAAADPSQFPESYEKYGAWQTKKLYLHLYNKHKIVMDWTSPMKELNGYSPMKLAQMCYAKHVSQHKYDFAVEPKGKYDNAKFGLAYTTVGYDKKGNDMMEHITLTADSDQPSVNVAARDLRNLSDAEVAEILGTPTQAPTQAPELTIPEETEPEDIAQQAPEEPLPGTVKRERSGGGLWPVIAVAVAAALAAGGAYAYFGLGLFHGKKVRRRPKR